MSNHVLVKPTDMIQAGTLLKRLSSDVDALREKLKQEGLDDKTKYALAGAFEVLLDLHNNILENIKQVRMSEQMDDSGRSGGFDA
ncbi:MAG: hypothetical protein A4S09_05045 [Proteobacteria bacterium SG_bin7]|nr:MAG: hypothetical protein A4S09_05045 [Proteobacteria bacterium SG_bin7]